MGLLDKFKEVRSFLTKEIRPFGAGDIAPMDRLPFLANWMYAAKLGMPRQINIVELRQYAKSAWVQMVIMSITKQIMTTDWAIVVDDEDEDLQKKYENDIERVKTFLEQPNRNGDAFWDVWIPFLRDVLEIDSGVVYKGRNARGELVELFAYDGARFLVNINEHGVIGSNSDGSPAPGYYQYSFRQISNAPIPFEKNEIIYGRMNTNTELFPYGWSPLQSVQQEVELMIQSTRFNKERFKNSAVPDGIVSVPMNEEQMSAFKNAWETQVKGRPHKLLFHNADATFTPLAMTNKDMEWLEGQKWYFHMVFAAYGLSPQEAGFFENSNRSTGETQERITIKNAIKPYLDLIAAKINREIIPDFVGHDEIKFKWFLKDDAAEKIEHEQTMAKLNASVITINEVRAKEGLDPVEWGYQPITMVMQQQFMDNQAQSEEKEDNPKDRDDRKEERDDNKEEAESKKKNNSEFIKGRVIAIGPRGGRIVGYGPKGEPIYEGSPADTGAKKPPKKEDESKKQTLDSVFNEVDTHHQKVKDLWSAKDNGSITEEQFKSRMSKIRDEGDVIRKKIFNHREDLHHDIVFDDSNAQSNIDASKGHYTEMSPKEYLRMAKLDVDMISFNSIKSIYQGLKSGNKLKTGFLEVEEGRIIEHEGRHRAVVAMIFKQEKIRVAIIGSDHENFSLDDTEVQFKNIKDIVRKSIEAGDELIEESEDYEEFLKQKFTDWETKILSFVERTLKDELSKEVVTKSFGEFLTELFNNVNTIGFRRGLIATVKASFKTGIEEVESELNVDIGFSPDMVKEATVMADRQLEGFYIEGKRWKGIKGVADDVQKEVSEIVRDGVVNREGIGTIKSQIQDRLEVTKSRATAIARTETTRFLNHSKIKSYQESGLVEFLVWDAFLDNRTSEQCEHLDKKQVSLGKFWTLKDGTEIAQPPAHVNCRSVVRPILKKG